MDEDTVEITWDNYMQIKKTKLNNQYREHVAGTCDSSRDDGIFKNISIFVNGLTTPSAEQLKEIMVKNSGIYHTYQMPSTTHIIASSMAKAKLQQFKTIPVVKPEWIVNSMKENRVLDHRDFLLIPNRQPNQATIAFPTTTKSTNNRICKSTASDSNFIQEFYQKSRLHLISTLSTDLKEYISNLRANSHNNNNNLPNRQHLKVNRNINGGEKFDGTETLIMHIDMDCFFVSVGLRSRPDLADQPVAVTHAHTQSSTNSHSEIASCNYRARDFGLRNGMFLGDALKLCPHLKTIPYSFDDYKDVSYQLYDTIATYTLDIEAVSCDEMYVDVTKLLIEYQCTIEALSNCLRTEIYNRTRCTCSTGFGANRLLARLATKRAKPNGWYHLKQTEIHEFLQDTKIAELPGIGWTTARKLQKLNLHKCSDLFGLKNPKCILSKELGLTTSTLLWNSVNGIDEKRLNYDFVRKSISVEINYGIRFQSETEALKFLEQLTLEVYERLQKADKVLGAKQVTLKMAQRAAGQPVESVKYLGAGICDYMSKSVTVPTVISDCKTILYHCQKLYRRFQCDFREVRGLGLHLGKLQYKIERNTNIKSKISTTSNVKIVVPNEIENFDHFNNVEYLKKPTIFNGLNWSELKAVLSEWFETDMVPTAIDIRLLSEYLQQLVLERKIEILVPVFNFFYRRTSQMNCNWHRAYFTIINAIQQLMVAKYGGTLIVKKQYENCHCHISDLSR